jgi:hypothetical protein
MCLISAKLWLRDALIAFEKGYVRPCNHPGHGTKQIASYLGLVPEEKSSGERRPESSKDSGMGEMPGS